MKKWFPIQCFGENVSNLFLSSTMSELDVLLFYMITKEVMTNIDVLGPGMMHRILRNIDSTSIITSYLKGAHMNAKIRKLLFQPKELSAARGNCNVFGFGG